MYGKEFFAVDRRLCTVLFSAAIAAVRLGGCATTIDQNTLDQRTSNAVGQPVGAFTISDRSEESGGRINYTVKTRNGANYRCYLYSPTGFAKVMTLGQTPTSDAICSPMGSGAAPGAQSKPVGPCNALLKAAGRC